MGERNEDGAGERERVEELLRTNAALAAELRSLALGRTDAPRRGALPTSRRLALLHDERDTFASERETLASELEAARAELASTNSTLADMTAHARRLEQHKDELEAEVTRLRSGPRGFLRRLRARLLRR